MQSQSKPLQNVGWPMSTTPLRSEVRWPNAVSKTVPTLTLDSTNPEKGPSTKSEESPYKVYLMEVAKMTMITEDQND